MIKQIDVFHPSSIFYWKQTRPKKSIDNINLSINSIKDIFWNNSDKKEWIKYKEFLNC
ncbi:MAG: hypothetical protein VW397_06900 [Candidatus Margulisiibacteriota bacterium]